MIREILTGYPDEKQAKETIVQLERRKRLGSTQQAELSEARKLTRRLFLRQSGIAAAGLALAGLGAGVLYSSDGQPIDEDIKQYYPELGYPLREKGSFQTKNNKRDVSWYNFTNAAFNQNTADELLSYYEAIGVRGLSGRLVTKEGKNIDYRISLHHPYPLKIFVVPLDAKDPQWGQDEGEGASTYLGVIYGVNLTRIKLKNPQLSPSAIKRFIKTPEENASYGFSIEAGQSTIIARFSSDTDAFDAQEVFCNSMGFALYARQSRFDYEQYAAFTQDVGFRLRIGTVPMIKFNEQQYNQIPSIPPTIYKK